MRARDGGNSEHDIELAETREGAPEAFELAEESFNFVAPFVEFLFVFPRLLAIVLMRHDGEAG